MNQTKGHPKGLYLLFVTEMWERFSYYGMRALFMLYMVQALLFDKEMASQVYGSYTGLVYLTPLIGGYIADRYWGNRRSIVVGALTMALGQFLLFLSACYFQEVALAKYLMFCGLGLLILGNGFFKPNISTMVGRLYTPDDNRKDSAFTIFYMGVNVGSTLAPLVCGLVGNTGHPEDFKWGFLAACIGMILGATVFQIFKNKYICDPDGNPVGVAPQRSASTTQQYFAHPSDDRKHPSAYLAFLHQLECRQRAPVCRRRLDWFTDLRHYHRHAGDYHYRPLTEPTRENAYRRDLHHCIFRYLLLGSLRTSRRFTHLLCR